MNGQADLAAQLRVVAGQGARTEARWLKEAAGDDGELLRRLVARRLAGEPVDRILGHRGFWSLELIVTPDTLSPRADSETVVEAARDHGLKMHAKSANLRLLDLGTGTGALLLALLTEFPQAKGIGVDISTAALDVANRNAALNQLAARATFEQGHWTENAHGPFDIIVSNPPYIPTQDIATLDREVREHDPLLALDGGADGMDAYRTILADCTRLMTPDGILVLEAGIGQAEAIATIGTNHGLSLRETRMDLAGIDRAVVFAQK